MKDLKMKHFEGFGDLFLKDGDLAESTGLFEMVYLALYGTETRSNDWWADRDLLDNEESTKGFYQKTIQRRSISNFSKTDIENAIKSDLNFLLKNNIAKNIDIELVENHNELKIILNIDDVLIEFFETI